METGIYWKLNRICNILEYSWLIRVFICKTCVEMRKPNQPKYNFKSAGVVWTPYDAPVSQCALILGVFLFWVIEKLSGSLHVKVIVLVTSFFMYKFFLFSLLTDLVILSDNPWVFRCCCCLFFRGRYNIYLGMLQNWFSLAILSNYIQLS